DRVYSRNRKGGVESVIGVTVEITELKTREEEIARAKANLEKINTLSPAIIYVYDLTEKKNLFANRSLVERLGYTEEEVQEMGSNMLSNCIHPDDLERVYAHHAAFEKMRDNETTELEYRFKHKIKNEYEWIISSEQVFERNAHGKPVTLIGIAQIVTEQKAREQALIDANAELERFNYLVSHDLKEPLRTIGAFSERLKKKYQEKLTGSGEDYLKFIDQAINRMQLLTKQLLDYSRLNQQQPDMVSVNLNEVMVDVLDNLQLSISENQAKIEVESLPIVQGDKLLMTILFQNLISNSIKYRKSDVISAIKVGYHPKGKSVTIFVKDNGIGIKPEYLDKIFEVFKRLHNKEDYEGSGIGLASCKRIVSNLGGRIWASSIEGEGSTFYVSFPV
ncbi:MAG: ATP-binding protein, partial [Bacteroidota bacterium]